MAMPPSWSQLVKTTSRFICRTKCLNFREPPGFSPNSSSDILSKEKNEAGGGKNNRDCVKPPYIPKMFGRNSYQIPQVSHSSLHSRDSASVIDFNEAELFHHHRLLSGSYLTGNAPVNEAAASFIHDSGGGGISGDPNSCHTKQAVKKDRHSKIYTSQGPRDRRVRLSIGIARKFFDLQEMLGVDKPSKTLDWLLTKSKLAIKDLVHTKQNTDKNDGSSTTENNEETLENGKSVGKRKSAGKQKGGGGAAKDPQVSLAKESRAKARARARERTREKMCIKQLQEQQLQQCMNNQLEICKISGTANNNNSNGFCLSAYEEAVNHQDMIHESIVIKRKVKHPSSIFGFQQNFIISKDLTSSNSGIPSTFPTSENWDVSSFNSQANIYAIWDHHRFVNSSSNN